MRPALNGDIWVCDSRGSELAESAKVEGVVGANTCLAATLKKVLELLENGVLGFELA